MEFKERFPFLLFHLFTIAVIKIINKVIYVISLLLHFQAGNDFLQLS